MVYSCQEKGTGTPYAAKILKKTVSVGRAGGCGVGGDFCCQSTLVLGRGCHSGYGCRREVEWVRSAAENRPWDKHGNLQGAKGRGCLHGRGLEPALAAQVMPLLRGL